MQLYNTNFSIDTKQFIKPKKNTLKWEKKKFHGLDIIIKCCVEWKRNDNDDDG